MNEYKHEYQHYYRDSEDGPLGCLFTAIGLALFWLVISLMVTL